jgi:ABC-type nitrate/sulfonate/bicarbonate transport system substrate-binding protein
MNARAYITTVNLLRAVLSIALAAAVTGNAFAADEVRVGKAQGFIWDFLPADVGIAYGIFAKYGLDVKISALAGDGRVQQALAADSIDFGLGSGPGMAFAAKGSPALAVAALEGPPRDLCIVVGTDTPIKTVADLKGKLVTVSTPGSLSDWLAKRLSITEGWGLDGIRRLALGASQARIAALRTKQTAADITGPEAGFLLEEKDEARILTTMDKYAPDFITHVVFARKDLIAKNPELVRRFLKGYFASIAYMKTHKEETDAVAVSALKETPTSASKTYDYLISALSNDGTFHSKAVQMLKQSFVDMGILKTVPPDTELFTTQFVPVPRNASR